MKKFLLLLAILLVASTLVYGAGQTDVKEKSFVIGFNPRAFTSVFFVTMADAMEEAVDDYDGIELQVFSTESQKDIEGQVKIIEDLIQKNVDLLAVSINEPESMKGPFGQANEKGIPIVVLDSIYPLKGVKVLSYIGHDNLEGGRLMGKFVGEELNGKGKIAVIEGPPGVQVLKWRQEGFEESLAAYPGIEIVAQQPANADRTLAMDVTENIMQAHPDIELIWCQIDCMAMGAIKALENAGRLDDIIVCGYNGDEDALDAISKGKLATTILQQPGEQGRMAVEIGEMIRQGKVSDVKDVYVIPVLLVDAENVSEFIH